MNNQDLALALKDPTNLSDAELEEIEKAQLSTLRTVKKLLGEAEGSTARREKKSTISSKRRALSRIKNRI